MGTDSATDAETDSATDAATDAIDAGAFPCDSGDGSPVVCDGRTQACKIVNGGVYPGIHAPACVSLPPGCEAMGAQACACVVAGLASPGTCKDHGGNITVTEDVP